MEAQWFRETVDLFFGGTYQEKYNEVMDGFLRRRIVKRKNGMIYTTVKPWQGAFEMRSLLRSLKSQKKGGKRR